MHFLEAHSIVHEFASAVGIERESILLPYSWVKHSKDELIDAFILFFGHMVMWQTRTAEEYEQYKIISKWIHYIVSDEVYDLIIDGRKILNMAEKNVLYRTFNKKEIEKAKKVEKIEFDTISKCFDDYKERIETTDFGTLVNKCVAMIKKHFEEPKETRKPFDFFMDDYITFLYGNTSLKEPKDEDFSCFWSFEKMREMLDDFDNLAPTAQRVYSQYRDYIKNSK